MVVWFYSCVFLPDDRRRKAPENGIVNAQPSSSSSSIPLRVSIRICPHHQHLSSCEAQAQRSFCHSHLSWVAFSIHSRFYLPLPCFFYHASPSFSRFSPSFPTLSRKVPFKGNLRMSSFLHAEHVPQSFPFFSWYPILTGMKFGAEVNVFCSILALSEVEPDT